MENKIIIANMKMNMDKIDISNYLSKIKGKIKESDIVFCPVSIYIPYFLKEGYKVGLQNIYFEEKGAFTGEISPTQSKSMNINNSIIGHSERRSIFKESDDLINKKVKATLNNNIRPILCIGETEEENNKHITEEVLTRQLSEGLKYLEADKLKEVVIAYEPVWAIGTGNTMSNDEIEKATRFIKEEVKRLFGIEDIKVLYGGSVNENNIESLCTIDNVDGFLVGGASTDPDKFLKIIEVAVTM
jgi:triosephosphate isomerase